MFKKTVLFLLMILCTVNVLCFAAIDQIEGWSIPVNIKVNNSFIQTDVSAFISDGSTYAPVRFVSEALGVDKIIWNDEEQSVVIQNESDSIKFFVGENFANVNGVKKKLGSKIILKDSRTFVPVRFIAESLGATVSWDSAKFIAKIEKEDVSVPNNLINNTYTEDDIYWLARIIEAECGGEPFIGKIGVGNVVLNRVESREYPDTIYDVIFDTKYGVQFEPVMNKTIYNTPSVASISAAKYALNGTNVAGESLYFLNTKIASSFWIVNNRSFYVSLYNHDFYL